MNKKYVWYSVECDAILVLNKKSSLYLVIMSLRHDFNFNNTMMYLGEL